MLRWLRGLFGADAADDDAAFRFHDGRGWRWADPLVVQRKLNEHGGPGWGDLVDKLKLTEPVPSLSPHTEAIRDAAADKAIAELADLVTKVFGVKPKEDGGLTQGGRIRVLTAYLRWVIALTEDALPLASPPPATASAGGG